MGGWAGVPGGRLLNSRTKSGTPVAAVPNAFFVSRTAFQLVSRTACQPRRSMICPRLRVYRCDVVAMQCCTPIRPVPGDRPSGRHVTGGDVSGRPRARARGRWRGSARIRFVHRRTGTTIRAARVASTGVIGRARRGASFESGRCVAASSPCDAIVDESVDALPPLAWLFGVANTSGRKLADKAPTLIDLAMPEVKPKSLGRRTRLELVAAHGLTFHAGSCHATAVRSDDMSITVEGRADMSSACRSSSRRSVVGPPSTTSPPYEEG